MRSLVTRQRLQEPVQKKSDGSDAVLRRDAQTSDRGFDAPPVVHEVLGAPGAPLDDETHSFMKSRLGHDFSRVRIHAGPEAARSAEAVGARAYTVGQHIVLGAGESARATKLLAHELTHTLQQGAPPPPGGSLAVGPTDSAEEREAEGVAEAAMSTATPSPAPLEAGATQAPFVARTPDETRAQVDQRVLNELIAIVKAHPIANEDKQLGKFSTDDEEPRRVPLRELMESVPSAHARGLHDRLEPGAAKDDFAAYLKLHLPNTRDEGLAVLRQKFVAQTAAPPAQPATGGDKPVGGEAVGKATATAAGTMPSGIPFNTSISDAGEGIRFNTDYWVVEYKLTRTQDQGEAVKGAAQSFRSSQSETAWTQAKKFLEAHPDWSNKQTLVYVTITVGALGATAAIKDVWNVDSVGKYGFECFIAATLTQLRGVYLAYPSASRDVAFDRDYKTFQIKLLPEDVPPQSSLGTDLETVTLDTPVELSRLSENPNLLNPGDQVPITNPYMPASGAWFTENTIYMGDGKFRGHPFNVFNLDEYSEHLAKDLPTSAKEAAAKENPDVDTMTQRKRYVLRHSYIKSYSRPRSRSVAPVSK